MEPAPYPITLERVFFTRSIIVAVPAHIPGNGVLLSPENKIDLIAIKDEPGRYQVTMHSTLNNNGDPSAPYIIDMECVGLFVADASLATEEATKGVMITAHSVLYGAIREAVAWITARQPFGQLILGLSVLQSAPSAAAPQPNE